MGRAFNIGKLFGVQLRLDYTWFLIFLVVTGSLSLHYFPQEFPGWGWMLYWAMGIVTSLLFFASVVTHELAHSYLAMTNGVPVKSITLFVFGGIAQITREARRPSIELKMAAAGPGSSLLLGGLFGAVAWLTQSTSEPLSAMAFWLLYVNVSLAAFNLLPGFPLDGGRVFRSILWHFTGNYERSTRIAAWVGRSIGLLMILGGILFAYFEQQWFSGVWLAFIGWFLTSAARNSYRQAQWRGALSRLQVSQVMTSEYAAVPQNLTISELVQHYVFPAGRNFFMVADGDRPVGFMTLAAIKSIPRERWDTTLLKDVAIPLGKALVAYPEQDVLSVFEEMNADDVSYVPVMNGDVVVGIIARDTLLRLLNIRSELGMK